MDLLELPLSFEEEIKKESIVKRVHFSTKIEGNLLNLNEVKDVIENKKNQEEIGIIDTLDKRERWVANYIITNHTIKAKDIANHFKINIDTANNWIKRWIEKDFLNDLIINKLEMWIIF